MSRTKRVFSESGYSHVVLRGNNRQRIFEDDEDRRVFLKFLRNALAKHPTRLISWCLMSNHVHLLVFDKSRNLSSFIQSISSGYAIHFNERHERVGHVFQGRFFSAPIESERYLLEAVRYIHHNPEKARIASHEQYPWSSYREYSEDAWLIDPAPVLEMTNGKAGFIRMHQTADNILPIDQRGEDAIDDAEALGAANAALANEGFTIDATHIAALDRSTRDRALCTLLSMGLSAAYISRISGIGKRTVLRARDVTRGTDPFVT